MRKSGYKELRKLLKATVNDEAIKGTQNQTLYMIV
jgi:hypothetical protein